MDEIVKPEGNERDPAIPRQGQFDPLAAKEARAAAKPDDNDELKIAQDAIARSLKSTNPLPPSADTEFPTAGHGGNADFDTTSDNSEKPRLRRFQLGQTAGSSIAGTLAEESAENIEIQEAQASEKARADMVLSELDQYLNDTLDEIWDAYYGEDGLDEYFVEVEEFTNDSLDLIQQELIANAQKIEAASAEIDSLKQQLTTETDPEKRAALEAEISLKQQAFQNANAEYLKQAENYATLNTQYNDTKDQLQDSQRRLEMMQEQIQSPFLTEENKVALQAMIEEEKAKISLAEQRIIQLEDTASQMREQIIASRTADQSMQLATPAPEPAPVNTTINNTVTIGNAGTFALAAVAGTLALQTAEGEIYKITDMTSDDRAQVIAAIQDGLKRGEINITDPDINAAITAAGATNTAPTPAPVPTPATDPVLAAQELAAKQLEEQAAREKAAQDALAQSVAAHAASGTPLSLAERNALIQAGVSPSQLDKEMAENNIKQESPGILGELLGFNPFSPTATSSFLFAGMAATMAGREITAGPGESWLSGSGFFGGGYRSFADNEFNNYNGNLIDPSYMPSPMLASLVGALTGFGQGPTSAQQQTAMAPTGPSLTELEYQANLRRQQELMAMMGMSGPKAPDGTQQA